MASSVRAMPAMSTSREPSAATPAATRTTGSAQLHPAAATTSTSGAPEAASSCGPSDTRAAEPTATYTVMTIANAMPIARGIVREGSRTSSPSVAMRA